MFSSRVDAGRRLAQRLMGFKIDNPVVLALPRGGVPVGYEVARALEAPLDVIVVRKLGVPFQPEVAMGAIGEGDVRVVHEDTVRAAGVTSRELATVEGRERAELQRRIRRYRGDRPRVPIHGRFAIVVDDGVATGATARAACQVARAAGARHVVLAVPVAPVDWKDRLAGCADEFICLESPRQFQAVGQCYRHFEATLDEEVQEYLDLARQPGLGQEGVAGAAGETHIRSEEVSLVLGGATVGAHLVVPQDPRGLVVFAHGTASSRHSPRNRLVASSLNESGFATLLLDLLSEAEELNRSSVFDIQLLSERLRDAARWAQTQPGLAALPVGYLGAGTGAAAALRAAAEAGADIAAVVSRGGRPDIARTHLSRVVSPTLLIVGERDRDVLILNKDARERMGCDTELVVVPGATHSFEEPGALHAVAEHARNWFLAHLVAQAQLV